MYSLHQYHSIVTPVNLIRKLSKTRKPEKASPEVDHDIEQEEDRIQGAPSKAEESQVSARSARSSKKEVEEEVEEETRDAPVEEEEPEAPEEPEELEEPEEPEEPEELEELEEPEEKESEDEFNQIVDPEVEERVLVLTESVDDLRAEFQEFKRVSTIERERLEFEVRQAKEELQRARMAPPAPPSYDDNSLVEDKQQSVLAHIASRFSEQFDDEGYMKCMLTN